jgi:hypothetical protein
MNKTLLLGALALPAVSPLAAQAKGNRVVVDRPAETPLVLAQNIPDAPVVPDAQSTPEQRKLPRRLPNPLKP